MTSDNFWELAGKILCPRLARARLGLGAWARARDQMCMTLNLHE